MAIAFFPDAFMNHPTQVMRARDVLKRCLRAQLLLVRKLFQFTDLNSSKVQGSVEIFPRNIAKGRRELETVATVCAFCCFFATLFSNWSDVPTASATQVAAFAAAAV